MSAVDRALPATKILFLWTHPRAISTALERSFLERTDTDCYHEPMSQPYYYGPPGSRVSKRYADDPVSSPSLKEVFADLLNPPKGSEKIRVIKDMAYFLFDKDGNLPEDIAAMVEDSGRMPNITHLFLLREPCKAVPSLYRLSVATKTTGWDFFDPNEAGFKELEAVFRLVSKGAKESNLALPMVLDANDLLARPEVALQNICDRVGVPLQKNMLHWEPREIPEWKSWSGWHESAQYSTGFSKANACDSKHNQVVAPGKGKAKDKGEVFPDIVDKTIAEATTAYDYFCTQPSRIATAAEPPAQSWFTWALSYLRTSASA